MLTTDRYQAAIFDMDGVLTDTASVHATAWKKIFDEFLADRPPGPGENHRPFTGEDYRRYLDGRSPMDGTRDFLAARGISLPPGRPDDPISAQTVSGLDNRKERYVHGLLATSGVRPFPDATELVPALRQRGLRTAVTTASLNCDEVLDAAGLAGLFDERVDGRVTARLRLPGKPDPAIFLTAAKRLGVDPARCVVFEDAEAGVQAARRGGFGLVVGVARTGHPDQLRRHGADLVVTRLTDMLEPGFRRGRLDGPHGVPIPDLPDGLVEWEALAARLADHPLVVCCDFDGTLSPVVDRPDAAVLPARTRHQLARLATRCPVAVLSGRDLADVCRRVGLRRLWYAGCHGLELLGPHGEHHTAPGTGAAAAVLTRAAAELHRRLDGVPGVVIEPKRYTCAVHYRMVAPDRVGDVFTAVTTVAAGFPGLRVETGRKVRELRPDTGWDKGRALGWLLDRLGGLRDDLFPIYLGDDTTDEDALRVVRDRGLGVLVRSTETADRPSAASATLAGPAEVATFLGRLADLPDRAEHAQRRKA